ncbi:radical SAM protein [bacterium]|nr:radical SAM protein [bacterium]
MDRLLRALKSASESPTVLLGQYPATVPAGILSQMTGLDFALTSDAEHHMAQFCAALEAGETPSVPGLAAQTSGQFGVAPPESASADLDTLPLPYRPWLENGTAHYRSTFGEPMDVLLTARGCPCQCSFCGRGKAEVSFRSIGLVLEEYELLVRAGLRFISIADGALTQDRDRCCEFLEGVLSRGLKVRMLVRSTVDKVDRELLRLMKRAGVVQIQYGMESGSEEVLASLAKPASVEMNTEACRLTQEAGIQTDTSWIVGSLPETPDSVRTTADLVERLRPTSATFFALLPLPGTPLEAQARELGWLRGGWSVTDTPAWVQLPWLTDRDHLLEIVSGLNRRFKYNWKWAMRYGLANWRRLRYSVVRTGLHRLRSG